MIAVVSRREEDQRLIKAAMDRVVALENELQAAQREVARMRFAPAPPEVEPEPLCGMLAYWESEVGPQLTSDRLDARSINAGLTALAESLAPELPYPTDEPFPPLEAMGPVERPEPPVGQDISDGMPSWMPRPANDY